MNVFSGCIQLSRSVEAKAETLHKSLAAVQTGAEEVLQAGMLFLNAQKIHRSARRDLVVAFCGELYGVADGAQALLQAFEKDGECCFATFEGNFAAVIYDAENGVVYLVRDKLGCVQLYYCVHDDVLVFSTDIKSIVSACGCGKLDREAVSQYFQLTYIPAPRTVYRDIKKLEAAQYLRVDATGSVDFQTYWQPDLKPSAAGSRDYETCKKQLQEKLTAAVERRLADGKAKGTFLSGGFDSTIITGIAARLSAEPLETFTISFEDKRYDELELAQLVAKTHGTRHNIVPLTWDMVSARMDDLVEGLEEPYADSSLLAAFAVASAGGQKTSAVLTGDGGDEVFAGYNKYLLAYYSGLYRKIPGFIRKGIIKPVADKIPGRSYRIQKAKKLIGAVDMDPFEQRKQLMRLGFKPHELEQLMIDGYVDDMEFIRSHFETFPKLDLQTRTQYVDIKTVLEGDMLPKTSIAGRLGGLVTRAPLLDTDVIEFALNLPSEYRIKKSSRKIILKDAFRDLIPEPLFHAPKHGFGVPLEWWLRRGLKEELYRYADRELLEKQGLFDAEYIRSLIDGHMAEKENRFSELWAFYVFQRWYVRAFGS